MGTKKTKHFVSGQGASLYKSGVYVKIHEHRIKASNDVMKRKAKSL